MKLSGGWDQVMCKSSPVFHAFTGCDTVSAFGGHRKKRLVCLESISEAFEDLMLMEDNIRDRILEHHPYGCK